MPLADGEAGILEAVRRRAGLTAGPGLRLAIGDDCAIYRPRGAPDDLLFTTDLLIEDVHFQHDTHPPEAVGHKALARGLSDIAAMGGRPRFCLLSLALGPRADRPWIDRFYHGLLQLARTAGAPLAGGDLAHAARTTCDIVVCGDVPRGTALRRDAARAGDAIYVSGAWAGPRWDSRLKLEGPGHGTCARNRDWGWACSCGNASARLREWILATGFHWTCIAWRWLPGWRRTSKCHPGLRGPPRSRPCTGEKTTNYCSR